MSEYIEVQCTIIAATDKAVLLDCEDAEEDVWVPLSLIEDNDEDMIRGYEGPLYIQQWFAEKEGLG